MQFLLGVVLFVVLIGAMDAQLPWPAAKKGGSGHKDVSNRNRTQWVAITPDQEDRWFYALQNRCQIRTVRCKPIRQISIKVPEFLPPVRCAQPGGIESSGTSDEHEMGNEVVFEKRDFDGIHASHRLSDQCGWLIDPRRHAPHEMFDSGD